MEYMQSARYEAGPEFVAWLRDAVRTTKVVHVHDVPEQENLEAFYRDLSSQLGNLEMRNEDVNTKGYTRGEWTDVRYDPARAMSFRYSNTRQPLHTDGSYIPDEELFDVLFLLCVEQARIGGATTFIDADVLVDYLRAYDAGFLRALETTPIHYARGLAKLEHRPIVDYDDVGILMNWNYFPTAKDAPPAERELVERFHAFLEDRIVGGGLTQAVQLRPRDVVYFHDRRVLHGRNSFWGDRCLLKGAVSF